jgi:hypothetical protein
MHKALMQKYNLLPEDEPFADSFMNFARAQNWPQTQIDRAFQWYREGFDPKASDADNFSAFGRYMAQAGASDVAVEAAGMWHDRTAIHGPEATPAPKVNKGQDAETIARAEHLLRHDRKTYFADGQLQIEYAEALARQSGSAPAPSARTSSRRAELESMIKDRQSDYYRGETGERLQSEYRALIAGDQGASGNNSPALSEGNP